MLFLDYPIQNNSLVSHLLNLLLIDIIKKIIIYEVYKLSKNKRQFKLQQSLCMRIRPRQKIQQPQPKQQQKSRGVRKFTFTNSSKALPRQHDNNEFAQIIDNKKIYQSMIKDELRKLQMLENCVHDPEVQSFEIPQDINTAKINRDRRQQKTSYQTGNTRHTSLSEKQIDIDQYLSKELNSKCIKQVQKIAKKFQYKLFIRLLIGNRTHIKNKKASNYFNYQRLTKKYFYKLKKSAIQDTQTTQNISQSANKLKKLLLAKNVIILKNSIMNYMLKDRLKVVRKTKQFKSKKQNLLYVFNLFKFQRLCENNINKIDSFSKSKALQNLIKRRKQLRNIQNSRIVLIKCRKNELWRSFMKKIKQTSSKNKPNMENLVKQYYNNNSQKLFNQKEIRNYASKNNFNNKQIEQFKLKLTQQQFRSKAVQRKQLKQKKQFLALLRKNNKFSKFSINFKILMQQKRKLQLFNKICQKRQFDNLCRRIKLNRSKFYLQNFILNSYSDIKFNNSLKNCLSGSKEWLIKNKHIFKAQPLNKNSSNPTQLQQFTSQNPFYSAFHHPMTNQTEIQLLRDNSRFRKCVLNHYIKSFIRALKQNQATKMRCKISIFAIHSLRNQRYKKKVWQILKDKELIKQVCNQINEQAEAQMDEQQIKNQQLIVKIRNTYKFRSLFNKLRQIKQLKIRSKLLQQKISQNHKGIFISRFKHNNQQSKYRQQLQQQFLQYFITKKYENINKFIKNLRLNYQNSIKRKSIVMKYQQQINISNWPNQQQRNSIQPYCNIGIQLIKITRQQKLFEVLSANNKISKSSIEITKLYLFNRIKTIRTNCKNVQKDQEMHRRLQQIKNMIRKKRFIQMITYIKSKMQTQDKSRKITSVLIMKNNTMFMKSLLQYCISQKKVQDINQHAQKLNEYLREQDKKNYLRKFVNHHNKLKEKLKNKQQMIHNKNQAERHEIRVNQLYKNNVEIENTHQQACNPRKQEKGSEHVNLSQNNDTKLANQIKSDNLFHKYLIDNNTPNSKFQKQNSNSIFSNQLEKNNGNELMTQQKNNFEYLAQSPHKQASNYKYQQQQFEHSNEEQVSYEQYRRSALLEENMEEISEQHIQQNSQNQQETKNHFNNQRTPKDHQQSYNVKSDDQDESISSEQENQNKQTISIDKLHNTIKEADKFEKSDISLNAISPQRNYHQQSDEQELEQMKSEEGHSELFSNQYLDNKHASGLMKRSFIRWKNQIAKCSQNNLNNNDLMTKAFEGLRIYYKQKSLAKKYLKQYEYDLHYYPHSPSEYKMFKQIADQT